MSGIIGIVFLLTLLCGIPIAFVIGITSVVAIVAQGTIPLNALPQYIFTGLDSFPLLAVPFFILAGELMGKSGISKRLIDFCMALFGRISGALAIVNVAVSVFFAGITGAAAADTAAIGSILIPEMKRQGYTPEYSAAVTAASSCIGPIIPPSIILVVYGIAANVSISSLLLAGFLPGVLLGICQGTLAYLQAKKYGFPKNDAPFSLKSVGNSFVQAIPALIMPVIIVGGIMTGVVTATEAASLAVVYSLLYGFITRTIRLKDLPQLFYNASVTCGIVLLIIGVSKLFSVVLTMNQIPVALSNAFLSISTNKNIIMLLLIALLLIVGLFMETSAACIILAPILVPVMTKLGVNPVQFGIVMCMDLALGMATPPVGVTLYVAGRIAGTSMEKITKAIFPYLIASIIAILLVAYVPSISLVIPEMFL